MTWVIFQKEYDEVMKRRHFDGEPIQESIASIFLDERELLNPRSPLSPPVRSGVYATSKRAHASEPLPKLQGVVYPYSN